MTGTAIREAARVAALILVLILAAALGLAVGNALQGRTSAGVGAQAPGAAADVAHPSVCRSLPPADPAGRAGRWCRPRDPGRTEPSLIQTRPSSPAS